MQDDYKIYAAHPEHVAVVQKIRTRLAQRTAVQYRT